MTMKKMIVFSTLMMFMMFLPMMAMASNCCPTDKHGGEKMAMNHGDHSGHEMHDHSKHMDHSKEKAHDMHAGHGGGFATIGEDTENGVKAVAKIMAYDDEKAAMINATHHIMVYFTDAKSGEAITSGKVALKVKGHGGEAGKPMMLMQMGEGFGADLRIEKGHYELEVGSKLTDGKKRQFEYDYMAQ